MAKAWRAGGEARQAADPHRLSGRRRGGAAQSACRRRLATGARAGAAPWQPARQRRRGTAHRAGTVSRSAGFRRPAQEARRDGRDGPFLGAAGRGHGARTRPADRRSRLRRPDADLDPDHRRGADGGAEAAGLRADLCGAGPEDRDASEEPHDRAAPGPRHRGRRLRQAGERPEPRLYADLVQGAAQPTDAPPARGATRGEPLLQVQALDLRPPKGLVRRRRRAAATAFPSSCAAAPRWR